MPLDRKNYSFLERERHALTASTDAKVDVYYAERQARMDATARAVIANLWPMNRPIDITQMEEANKVLYALAGEAWSVALAMEHTREGYDCRAMRGKRQQEEEAAKAINNVD